MNQLCTWFVYLKFLFSPSLLSCVLWTSTACIYQTPLSPSLQLPAVIKGRRQREIGRCKEGGGVPLGVLSLFFSGIFKRKNFLLLWCFFLCALASFCVEWLWQLWGQ